MDPRSAYFLGVATAFAAIALVWGLFRLLGPWALARFTGSAVSLGEIIGMRMRGTDPALIVAAVNTLGRLGEEVTSADVEVAYLGLPPEQRTLGALVREVRPELIARLERESQPRHAGDAA